MEFENLIKLIQTVSDSGLTELKYETDSVKMVLSKKQGRVQVVSGMMTDTGISENGIQQIPVSAGVSYQADTEAGNKEVLKTSAAEGHVVTSPLVGVFYAAPAENAQPFVTVGDRVKKGQILAIVEAMKLMNDIECEFDGSVAEIFVENGQPVEYGQPLFRIV